MSMKQGEVQTGYNDALCFSVRGVVVGVKSMWEEISEWYSPKRVG